MALPVFKTEVFDSEGTMAIIDPRLSDPEQQSDVVYVQRQRDLNNVTERVPPLLLTDDEYQAIIDRISFVVGLTEDQFTALEVAHRRWSK